jgi:hypothetical protein
MTQGTATIAGPVTLPTGTYVAIVKCAELGTVTADDVKLGTLVVKVIERTGTTHMFKFHCLHGGWKGSFNMGIVHAGRHHGVVSRKSTVVWHGARSSLPALNSGQDTDSNDVFNAVQAAALASL